MRIIGIMVCGFAEADRYLEKSLKEFKRLCDDAIIVTNNADKKTIQLIEKYGYNHYEDNREWGIDQPRIKTDLLHRAGDLKPDWIIAIDSDEVFAPEFTRQEAERLANTREIAYHFMVVNLYNDEKHFAHDKGIQRFWNIRFYKYASEFGLTFQSKALHCGLGPPIMYKYGWYAPYYLLHYGLMKKRDRELKAIRYQKYDPKHVYKAGEYYSDLEKELKAYEFDPKALLNKLRELPETQPRQAPTIMARRPEEKDYVFVKRLKDGMVLDIPRKDLEATLKRGFEIMGTIEAVHEERYEVKQQIDRIECPICGTEFKSKAAKTRHQKSHE